MARTRHPIKEIEDALRHAEQQGWRISVGGSHVWGKIYCPLNSPQCRCQDHCISSVFCTPRNAFNHARRLRQVVDGCVMNRVAGAPLATPPKE